MSKPKKKLAPAFVISLSLLTLPLACGDDGNGGAGPAAGSGGQGSTGGSTSARPVECPATRPTAGTPCTTGASCFGYANGTGCSVGSVCPGGVWVDESASCNPPAPQGGTGGLDAAGGSGAGGGQAGGGPTAGSGGTGNAGSGAGAAAGNSGAGGSSGAATAGTGGAGAASGNASGGASTGTGGAAAGSGGSETGGSAGSGGAAQTPCPMSPPPAQSKCDAAAYAGRTCTSIGNNCEIKSRCDEDAWNRIVDTCGAAGGSGTGGAAGGQTGGSGGATQAPCPMSPPPAGSTCDAAAYAGRTCTSIGNNCEIKSRCDEGAWKRIVDTCGGS